MAALMREQDLAARSRKRRKGTTRPGRGRWRAPDLVKRRFAAGGINRRWYGDGTEVVTGEGKLYLDSVTGTGSRRIVGFALGEHHDAALAYGALAMAVAVRGGAIPGVVFHTGQGSEYTARTFWPACVFLGCAAAAALTAVLGVGACASTAPSHTASALPPATSATASPSASARGSIKGIPFYQPSTVHSHMGTSATLTSPNPVTKVSDYYVNVVDTGGWTIVSKSITAHSGNLTVKKSGQGATISVAPSGSGSLISISTYPTA